VALSSTTLAFLAALELVREFVPPAGPDSLDEILLHVDLRRRISRGFRAASGPAHIIMLLVVTGVGWLIHIYSTVHARRSRYRRFFSYLNLFMFSCCFWCLRQLPADVRRMGGVGLCSYCSSDSLLKQSAPTPATKLSGKPHRRLRFHPRLLLILRTFGTLDFATVLPRAAAMPAEQAGVLTTIACSCSSARRKIGAASFVRVAAGRDGRPHAG